MTLEISSESFVKLVGWLVWKVSVVQGAPRSAKREARSRTVLKVLMMQRAFPRVWLRASRFALRASRFAEPHSSKNLYESGQRSNGLASRSFAKLGGSENANGTKNFFELPGFAKPSLFQRPLHHWHFQKKRPTSYFAELSGCAKPVGSGSCAKPVGSESLAKLDGSESVDDAKNFSN